MGETAPVIFQSKNASHPAARQATQVAFPHLPLIRLDHVQRGSLYPTGPAPDASYPPGQLDVLLHDGDALGVDGAEVRVLKQVHQEGLGRLLQRQNRLRLPAQLLARWPAIQGYLADLLFSTLAGAVPVGE
jgi:hypothetical protein